VRRECSGGVVEWCNIVEVSLEKVRKELPFGIPWNVRRDFRKPLLNLFHCV
jgi:hypothetical protein